MQRTMRGWLLFCLLLAGVFGRIYKVGEASGESPLSAAGRDRGRGPSVSRTPDLTPRPPSRTGKGESFLPLPQLLSASDSTSVPDYQRARKELARILAREEFEELATDPELAGLWQRFKASLKGRRLPRLRWPWKWDWPWDWPQGRSFGASGPWSRLFLYISILLLVAGVVALALTALYRFLTAPRSPALRGMASPAPSPGATGNALDHTSDEWRGFADGLVAQGNLREALRALYLGLLVYLHRARLIHYHPALTNWQYVRRYAGGERGQSLLRQLTQVFDEKWYGHLACRREEYEAFAQGVQTLIGETSA